MGFQVQFNYATWAAIFPELAGVSQPAATGYFMRACMFVANDGSGPFPTMQIQTNLLYLLTAHLAYLNSPRDASGNISSSGTVPAPQTVGRIQTATQGSVSVSLDAMTPGDATEAWYAQSRYGFEYWTASLPWRTARYTRGWTRQFDPFLVRVAPWQFRGR